MAIVCSNKKKVFGTKEWASCTFNNILGCSHDCLYCYSKAMAVRFKRSTPDTWKDAKLTEKKYTKKKIYDGKIMYPSTHDITPELLDASVEAIGSILYSGNSILIVSKPHLECIQEICEVFSSHKDRIMFRFTIGSAHSDTLSFWEPGAPAYEERYAALEYAYSNGFTTSVSIEPILDNSIEQLVQQIRKSVSTSIWLGEANFLFQRFRQNGITSERQLSKAKELLALYESGYLEYLFNIYRRDPKIYWKESLKKRFGLAENLKEGLDI